ncbi:MAG: YihY/virulence factor BrkB family protein [Desulfobacterales bacterium]|nr:YihY/virulence factor BrkB family protein [Desulfobacterales bacterium]
MKIARELKSKTIRFIKIDIWRIRLKRLSPIKAFSIKQLRIVLLTLRGFNKDKCVLRASALTFYSLLSIVPVLAMVFGIAKGFGFEKLLEKELLEKFVAQQDVVIRIADFAHNLLENTKGGLIAGIGVVVLFWTVIKLLSHIESSLNDIWKIKKSRTLLRKFTDYLFIIMICPILVIMAGSVTVFITTQVTLITAKISLLGFISPLIFFLLKFLPYVLIWGLFTLNFIFMPNTKVNFTSSLIAGILSGTIFQIAQLGYITFQVGVTKYNAIYGSFAALPLFLIWLQLSWLIVLFGAEFCFAHQNVYLYEYELDCRRISLSFRKLISLQIARLIIINFSKGKDPLSATEISGILEMPILLVHEVLQELAESRILTGTMTEEYIEPAFQPALDINILTIQYIIEALDRRGIDTIPTAQTNEFKALSETLQKFRDAIEKLPENKLLKDI